MTQWVAVSRTEHADTYFWLRQGYGFAAQKQVVPVLIAELTKLLPYYALAFIQQDEGSHQSYQPVALTGLNGEHNLYVHSDGRSSSNVGKGRNHWPFKGFIASTRRHSTTWLLKPLPICASTAHWRWPTLNCSR